MKIVFAERASEDYLWWQAQDRKTLRRITSEHRLVYRIAGDELRVAASRYHYEG